MKRPVAAALALVCLLAPAARSQSPQDAAIRRVETGLSLPVVIQGDPTWTVEERMRHYKVPGLSVAVVKDFKVVWAKGYGVREAGSAAPVTTKTLFQAGSISKPVAATVTMKKVEEGKLRLDEDVNAFLKSWKLPDNELTAKKKVTLGNILSHTAGLTVHGFPGYAAGAALPSLPQVLDGAAPANTAAVRVDMEPGTKFRYSGGGTTISQLVLQDLEGRPFDQIARTTVLEPYGMTDSTYSQPLPEPARSAAASGHRRDGSVVEGKFHTYPEMAAAGLWTTPTDLAKFLIETKLSFAGKSNKVLSQKTVERMVTPFLGPETGLGFFVEMHGAEPYFGHNGADEGFTAILLGHRTKGYGAVLMINSDNFALMPEMLRSIAREYRWDGFEQPLARAAVPAEKLAAYAGRFKLDAHTPLTVTAEGGRLYVEEPFETKTELVPVDETTFVRRDQEARYVFERAPSGRVERLSLRAQSGTRDAGRMAEGETLAIEKLRAGRVADAAEEYRKLKAANPADPLVSESRINGLGYWLLGQQKTAEAILVFRLNVELYPQSGNVYDSLGEAYMTAGDKEQAIKNYARSLELDPKNQNAVRMLEKLKK